MFSGRRRRRRKSSPSPQKNDVVSPNGQARSRRHSSGTSNESLPMLSPGGRRSHASSPLPTHYHSPSANNTCNNFLLGGHYYPGKDKKRRHMRRRTFWHRWFCSSPSRVICSTLVVGYIALWHMLVPMTHVILDYGRILSGHPLASESSRDVSADLENLRPTEEEKMFSQQLWEERRKILFGSRGGMEKRMMIYERIVPEWFRIYGKNTTDTEKDSNKRDRDANNVPEPHKEETGRTKKKAVVDAKAKTNLEHHESNPNNEPQDSKTTQDGNKQNETTQRVLRTMNNMDTLQLQSSCPATMPPTDINTTLVVQSSLDRVWILEETCTRWKDPVVAVVYLRANDVSPKVSKELKEYETKFPQLKIITHEAPPAEETWEYPVNVLRNTGLDAASTSHILVTDIDFVPSMNLDEVIRETLQDVQAQTSNVNSTALVVPAFERIPPKPCDKLHDCAVYLKQNSSFIPQTFDDLRSCVTEKRCSVFQQGINWEGHYSTHSESWLKGDFYEDNGKDPKSNKETGRRIKAIKCLDSLRYEPYVVLRWCPLSTSQSSPRPVAPFYDERFYGYGKNKIELISHLRFMGYSFNILPRGFIVHNPHPESNVKEKWNNKKDFDLHDEMDELYSTFVQELWEKYQDRRENVLMPCKKKK